ncbi:hypothetical protein GJ496_003594 [Pomphorhynchus laevis]|nr:hypothetical protein GJ496_003594 [Pomphorhynchus laevis]
MFLGSFVVGLIPLALSRFHTRKLKWIVAFGAGLMLSSCTQVIIPEVFYRSMAHDPFTQSDCSGRTADQQQQQPLPIKEKSEHHYEQKVGFIFTLGFVFMCIVDNLAKRLTSRTARKNHWVTTFGLCIHSAADGIVIAFAVLDQNKSFRFIVLLAVAIHKAPAAFGLVTQLLDDEQMIRRLIIRHLLIFCLTSPLVAIFTFIAYNHFYNIRENVYSASIPLLFSAGTFLYIATSHTIPDLKHCSSKMSAEPSSYVYLPCFVLGCLTVCLLSISHAH